MDRTLSILDDLGYDKIIIVCGYREDLFRKYEGGKVKVLVNERFAYTSSMASLAVAREEIEGGFMLLEGDTFYEREVIESLSQSEQADCLVLTEVSGIGDVAFVETF